VSDEGPSRRGQRDATGAAGQQRDTDFLFQVPDLAAERGLRSVQAPLGCQGHAAFLGDRYQVAKMPQLHALSHACEVWRPAYKVFCACAMRPQIGVMRKVGRYGTMSSSVVLVTGALTGIGRATALAFAKDGARLIVSGRHDDAGQALADELGSLGAEAGFIRADVRRDDEMRKLVEQVAARFGRLDIAVNNAGTEGKPGPVTEQDAETYAATFDTNVLGTLLSMKHELRFMQAQGSGSIVNISSTMGERGAAGLSLYTGSKHAVEGITKSAALEAAAFGVRVNAVAPGPTDTGMLDRLTGSAEKKAAFYAAVPLKRGGRPEEIADAILFLASPRAAFITGQIIRVNGGKTAS
jgi:NAD(P)-dependent dehydrogenase (short-subunit alcohol dehydrogenase family)